MEEKRKYLEYFDGVFDSTVADKMKPENWPYVAYSKTEGMVYTVIPDEGTNGECIITKVEVMDDSGVWEELSERGINNVHISSGPYPGLYYMVRVYGENLVVNNKYNFTFSGWSPWEGIEDPNNTEYWRPVIKDSNMCELESLAEADNGISPKYPFVIPGTTI